MGVDISKFLVVAINIIFMIFGLAALVVGVIFKLGWDNVRGVFGDNSKDDVDIDLQEAGDTLAYGAIIIGSFIVVLSLIGCIGACWRVKLLLTVYAIVIILLLVAQIVIVALIVSYTNNSHGEIAKALKGNLKNYYENSTTESSKGYSALFNGLECCGVEDYKTDFTTDTAGISFYPAPARDLTKYGYTIPITCCKGVDENTKLDKALFTKYDKCLTSPSDDNAHTKGCLNKVVDEIDDKKGILIGVGVTIFVIEVLVIILSFVLCCRGDRD